MSYKTAIYDAKQVFDPAASVFVSANAGAGKTSLLTNRVLALLLHGNDPSKLLCLTYTHAAATEMSTRILEKLGGWVMAGDSELASQLTALTSENPTSKRLLFARSLFAKVLETPDGLRIQTIHGFCQSLLRRFPLEAGVSPHFSLMDARTEQELLKEASLRLFSLAQNNDEQLQAILNAIAHRLSESSFHNLLAEIIKNKRRIRSFFTSHDGIIRAQEKINILLNIPKGSTVSSLIQKYFSYEENTLTNLRGVCARLCASSLKTDQVSGQWLAAWLEKGKVALDDYIDVFITAEGEKRKKLYTQKAPVVAGDHELLLAEQERVWNFIGERNALETAERSTHILHLAEAILALYDKLKSNHALIDYDDLILTARSLLQKPNIAPWVLYKLDGGIDHILVDEAQDTSPEQWDIVEALTEEFFAGVGSSEQFRSLFVVGDEKQSIYSFQGAAPKTLAQKEQDFSLRINGAAMPLHKVQLTHSFRSTPQVLSIVDSVFSLGAARDGLMFGSRALIHIPTRLEAPGLVELWPLAEPLLEDGEVVISSKAQLARRIADTLGGWFANGLWLDSKGRPVAPGDIMILIRKRTVMVDMLIRELKRRNIPVAGHDRMALGENLAVQDLMALGQCLLLPEDDLTLAALLKSPIFGLSEETLFSLCVGRGKQSLWEWLRNEPDVAKTYCLLSDLRAKADYISPYELYSYALDTCGTRRRFTGRMGEEYQDAIDEFLGQALLYERSHTASLQGFLAWLSASDSEIKRDMEQAKNCIRIMTVHGAKGLQAPIVLLPDIVDVPRMHDTLVWYNDEEGGLPFWPASSKKKDFFTAELLELQKQEMLAEYRRLLYVALTRAEDRLYIAGFRPHQAVSEHSWHQLIENGMKPLATPFNMEGGQGLRYGDAPTYSRKISDIGNTQGEQGIMSKHDFTFLQSPAPADPVPSQPLTPSHLLLDEPAALSPLSTKNAQFFQRGNLIHRLLQYLPQVASADRKNAAISLSGAYRPSVADEVIQKCIDEAIRLMDNPKISFLFAHDALTEVPVAGCVTIAGKTVAVAGQIDRLCIRENEVWIVDYKSNRLRPANVADIPASYGKQMALYHKLLEQIFPEKTIRCALLWTVDATITLLDESWLSSYI